jgi:hypothetical protein
LRQALIDRKRTSQSKIADGWGITVLPRIHFLSGSNHTSGKAGLIAALNVSPNATSAVSPEAAKMMNSYLAILSLFDSVLFLLRGGKSKSHNNIVPK